MTEEIEQIKEKIFKKSKSKELHISRVPEDTFEIFTSFAKEEFCDDRGMALKYLVSEMLIKPPIYFNLQEQIYKIFEELEQLKKEKSEEKQEKKITRTEQGSRVIRKGE